MADIGGGTGIPYSEDRNPAHIIYEVLTAPVVALDGDIVVGWGAGYTESDLDLDSFVAAADTLYSEYFGLSIAWEAENQTAEDFITEILRHIDGSLYMDQSTGKLVLKLVRDDYDIGDLTVFDENSIIEIRDYNEQLLHDTINEVTVTYNDQVYNKERSFTVQDIALQNVIGVVSQTNHYPGISTPQLAAKVALRDLKQLSSRLIKMTAIVNRTGYDVKMNDVIVLRYPDYGIVSALFRVGRVDYGELLDGRVRLELITDVFGVEESVYAAPDDDTEWEDPLNEPDNCPEETMVEATYFELVEKFSQDEVDTYDDDDGMANILGSKPSADASAIQLYTDETGSYTEKGNMRFTPWTSLSSNIDRDDTFIDITGTTYFDLAYPSTVENHLAYIGNELVWVVDYTDDQIQVKRGVFDTVATEHLSGTSVWFFESYRRLYTEVFSNGESFNAKLLPETPRGVLDLASAFSISITFNSRMIRPLPPGKLRINTEKYPDYITGSLTVAWAHRDRTQQLSRTVTEQDDGNVGPETGTTYTLTIYDENDVQIKQYTGLSSVSQTYYVDDEITDFGHADNRPSESLRIELKSVRDGYDSWTEWDYTIAECRGYGMFYGEYYGE
jgi:hypothetical protein